MKRTAIIYVLALLLVPCLAQADIAEIMSYQGVLRDASGNPVPDDDYMVRFMIYDVETGGAALWIEDQTLTATGGIINAHLGSVTTLTTLEFDVPYWLSITIEHGAELVPRTAFTTVPYAVHAGFADTCLEGDDDWQYDGDDIYHDVGNVGIGTATPGVKLDVVTGDAMCARFENSSGAVYGTGGPDSRGAHFSSEGSDALFAYSADAIAVWGRSGASYAGYFDGGGLGVYIDDQLETNGFRMTPGAASGYVLTSDGSGYGTWQPAGTGADGDWTIAGSDMYSGVAGRVGIGTTLPTAKLEIYNGTAEEALEVKHSGTGASRTVNIERTNLPNSGNDVLQLKVPAGSPDDCEFIECERGGTVEFAVDGDGSITAAGKLEISGTAQKQAEFSTSSGTQFSSAVSGVITGTGTGHDPAGVYGEGEPSDSWGVGVWGEGGYAGIYGRANPAGSDHYRGVYGYVYGGSGTNYGVRGYAASGNTNYGVYGYAYGGTAYAGYFSGHAHVTGTFTAGVKSFKIDHPLDPQNKYLLHSCVESDDMMNIYNGNVTLDAGGEASVEMPGWFEALNQDFRYQLTCIGGFAPVYVAETVRDGRFSIAGGEPGMVVSWQVTGVRHDPLAVASRMAVEVDKPANEVGKYMHPEAYGMPVTAGVDYHEERELSARSGSTERKSLEAFDPNDGE
jgi:hypothetical protein